MDRIYIFDTTLRDGGQTKGVDFSFADKIAISEALDDIGIDYIEGGWPGANPTDDKLFNSPPRLKVSNFVAFGMTRRPNTSAANDPGLSAVLNGKSDSVCLVGKTWDFHVDKALNISLEENIKMIGDSIHEVNKKGKEALFDQIGNQLGDVPHTYADISKAQRDLDYQPKTSLKDGLKKLYNSLK